MLNILYQNGKIVLTGRNKDGKREIKTVDNYLPYIYVPESEPVNNEKIIKIENNFKSIFGENLKKIFLNNPGDVPGVRGSFSKTFESDIPFVDRFLIDNFNLFDKNEPLRYNIIDIEVDSSKEFPVAAEAKYPIISICCYDNFLNKTIVFIWREDLKEDNFKFLDESIYYFNNEKSMIKKFVAFFRDTAPDLTTGWNCLDENTTVIIENRGAVPIKSAYVGEKILSFDNKTSLSNYTEIKNIRSLDSSDCYKIHIDNGEEFIATGNHQFLVSCENKIEFKTVNELCTNCYFIQPNSMSIESNKTNIENFYYYLCGLAFADGTMKNSRVRIYSSKKEFALKIFKLCKKYKIKCSLGNGKYHKDVTVSINDKKVVNILSKLGLAKGNRL
ncbi:MAG: 3'-5' exonuclease, partial [Nanoarchaeota archaeon]